MTKKRAKNSDLKEKKCVCKEHDGKNPIALSNFYI